MGSRATDITLEGQDIECNGHGHFKKECPNYLKSKGEVYATTLSDSDSSDSDSEESCNGEGNY